jgi:pimeloyl-ACP methyl ester carboxylesterase
VLRGLYFDTDQFGLMPETEAFLQRRVTPTLAFHRSPDKARWEKETFLHPYSHEIAWEGAGHWLHQERAAEFNRLALSWIADLPPFA